MKKIVLFCLLFTFFPLQAASLTDIKWQGHSFIFVSKGAPLSSVIKEFSNNYMVPVNISPQITDIFTGRINGQTPDQVMDELRLKYNLIWYYDSSILYVYKTNEVSQQLLTLTNISVVEANQYLQSELKLDNSSACNIRTVNGISGLQISGVPVCIANVTRLVQQLDSHVQKEMDIRQDVQVYTLKYASAADSVYQYRNQPVTVPGLVAVLNNIYNNSKSKIAARGAGGEIAGTLSFTADPRQNAIIIRGSQKEVLVYSDIIRKLDVKPIMIEISVDIFEVDASNFKSLGVQWSGNFSVGGNQLLFNNQNVSNNNNGAAGNYAVINNTNGFLIQLNALEQTSKVRVLSRPSVVTLNNIQAVLDKSITFYTKVTGQYVANLNSVTTGSLLRVTPHYVNEKNNPQVMLDLNIQDGQQSAPINNTAEELPQVQNSEISTQATLKMGQSLLLGGFVQEQETETQNKIPILSSIPLLGHLFTSTDHNKQRVMRLFLIKAVPVTQGE